MNQRNNFRGFLYMVQSSLLFALMSAAAHALGPHFNWTQIVFCNNFVSTLAALAFLGGVSFEPHEYRNSFLWLRCVLGGLGTLTAFYAFSHTSISVAITIMNTSPMWVALIRRFVYRDRMPPVVWLMILLGILGVALIQAPSIGGDYLPLLAANTSAIVNALVHIFLHELSGFDSRKVVFSFSLISTVLSLVLLAILQPPMPWPALPDPKIDGFLIGMGLFAFGGQMTMTRAFAVGHPTAMSLATLWVVVFALILDLMFFGRTLSLGTAAGIGLIMTASIVIKNKM